jgi:hypothetical protein
MATGGRDTASELHGCLTAPRDGTRSLWIPLPDRKEGVRRPRGSPLGRPALTRFVSWIP